MTEQSLGERYSKAINVLIFLFPVVINSVKGVSDLILLILAGIGIFIAISQKLSPFNIKEIKVLSYLTVGYFFAVCLSVIFSGKAAELAHFLTRDYYFLFTPFIALAFYKAEINLNYLLKGIKVGLIVLGLIVIDQLSLGVSRPSGVMNAGVFGNLVVSMFIVALVFIQYETFKQKFFTCLSLLSGLFVIVASGTRAAWVTLLLLLGVYLFQFLRQKNTLRRTSMMIAILAATIFFVGSLNTTVNDRVHLAYNQASNWLSGDKSASSVGLRLEMYEFALDNIEDVPFFGHGLRTSNIVLFENASGSMKGYLIGFNHLHNAYLTSLYNGGIVLLVTLLLILIVPFSIFVKGMSKNRGDPVFLAGVLLTLGFASHGMFGVLFGDVFMNAFYVFFLVIFLLLAKKNSHKCGNTP